MSWSKEEANQAAYETFAASDQLEECESCGKLVATLTPLGNGWNFRGCDACVADAMAQDAQEAAAELPAIPELKPITLQVARLSAPEYAHLNDEEVA